MMQYKEGDIIQITLVKEIGLNKAEQFYLFKTLGGDKFLLDKLQYGNYKFEKGKTITARIDRINCSGQIFIEPEHPIYKDSGYYDFAISEIISISEEADVFVKDCFDNTVPVKIHPNKVSEHKIKLGVAFVRKGVPVLFDPDLEKKFDYKEREIYTFIINEIRTNSEGEEEIILSDAEGILQFLPARYYSHYHLKEGQSIRCEVVRVLPGRRLSLEPVHPTLSKGETVSLSYISPISEAEAKFHRHKLHKLKDKNSQIYLISDRFITNSMKKGMHLYRIDAFKKGQVYVKPVSDYLS